VGWYQLAPGDRRLLTYAADGGLRLIALHGTIASERFVPLSNTEFWWDREQAPDADVRFVTDPDENLAYFRWSDDDGIVHAASKSTQQGYHVRELQYDSGGTPMSASLFVPRTAGTHAAAVMIHGSGNSDRDNLWYMWIAHSLVEEGIAVLLPDKRGCGKSGGDWKTASFEDFARDARAAVRATRGETDIDPSRVGLVGISQGGWIAPLAASTLPRLAFLVSVSGATVTPNEQLQHELGQNRIAVWFAKLGRHAWWKKNGDFDPLPYWATFAGPSLVVYGEEDEEDNVPVGRCEALLQTMKRRNPHLDMTIRVFEETGHGFFETGTKRIRQDFLNLLARWIGEKT
jgi:pimeloyl-ACP methyl ester carboxylesterase